MKKLKVTDSTYRKLRAFENDRLTLVYDYRRRLANALNALKDLDPAWRKWYHKNIRRGMTIQEKAVAVERQARTLLAEKFPFDESQKVGLINSNSPFTDNGTLWAR